MNKLFTALTAAAVVALLWISASYADIIADNNEPNPEHAKNNLIIVTQQIIDDIKGG